MQALWEYLTFRKLVGTTLVAVIHAVGLLLILAGAVVAAVRGAGLVGTAVGAAALAAGLRLVCEVLYTLCDREG